MSTGHVINVVLCGGPLAGTELQLPRGTEEYTVTGGFWTYRFAGRLNNKTYLAIWPRVRRMQRALMEAIRQTGRHPWVERSLADSRTVVGRTQRRVNQVRKERQARRRAC